MRAALAYLAALAAAVSIAADLFLFRGLVTDNACVTLRGAEHLAHGRGPVFDPGERVEAYTSPAWLGIADGRRYLSTADGELIVAVALERP